MQTAIELLLELSDEGGGAQGEFGLCCSTDGGTLVVGLWLGKQGSPFGFGEEFAE